MAWDDLRLRVDSRIAGIIVKGKEGEVTTHLLCFIVLSLYQSITHQHTSPDHSLPEYFKSSLPLSFFIKNHNTTQLNITLHIQLLYSLFISKKAPSIPLKIQLGSYSSTIHM